VEDLSKINGVNFFLMGKKNSHNLPHNIEYLGEFNAGTPPRIVNGVALIWDGDNVESCTGNYGNYLKYNIPHKSSLYLALGLPVITWKKSFISTFILEENIGCSVSSLHEITPELIKNLIYLQEKDNFSLLQEKVKNGFFIKSALKKAELSL
jgi:hypothetical protein